MAEHRRPDGSDLGILRARVRQLMAEIDAVTGAMSGREPPQFSVVEAADEAGNPVLRPVTPRRRAVREALRGSRFPALVLPLACAWHLAKSVLVPVKAAAAVSKGTVAGRAALAAAAAAAIPAAGVLAVWTARVPGHDHDRAGRAAPVTVPTAVAWTPAAGHHDTGRATSPAAGRHSRSREDAAAAVAVPSPVLTGILPSAIPPVLPSPSPPPPPGLAHRPARLPLPPGQARDLLLDLLGQPPRH